MGSGNCGSCAPGVGVYWKKNCICKWTHAVQTGVVQGWTGKLFGENESDVDRW